MELNPQVRTRISFNLQSCYFFLTLFDRIILLYGGKEKKKKNCKFLQ